MNDIYLIEGRDSIAARKAWGYCDGKSIFIKVGWNLFELNKQDKSFAFMGNKKLTHSYSSPGSYQYSDSYTPVQNLGAGTLQQLLFSRDKFKLNLVPMQLDMETGESVLTVTSSPMLLCLPIKMSERD